MLLAASRGTCGVLVFRVAIGFSFAGIHGTRRDDANMMRADGECDAERAGMAGAAKCMPTHFFGRRMKFVFKNSEIGGEKYGFGLRATDPMFVAVFGKIGRIPLEPCDLGPIDHV